MPRYILLVVDDNEMAGDLVAAINDHPQGVFFYKAVPSAEDPGQHIVEPLKDTRAVALYAKPNKFCECTGRIKEAVKGQKLGWYVCPDCGKPRHGASQHPRNLLEPPSTHVSKRGFYLGVWEPEKPQTVISSITKENPNYRGKRDVR